MPEEEGREFSHPWLYSKFEANLGYRSPYLKKIKIKRTDHTSINVTVSDTK